MLDNGDENVYMYDPTTCPFTATWRVIGAKWKGTRVPSFDEILSLCKGRIGIYLDLKDGDIAEVAANL